MDAIKIGGIIMKTFKRIISIVIATVITFSSMWVYAVSVKADTFLLGDTDCDGDICITDATLVQRDIAQIITLTGASRTTGENYFETVESGSRTVTYYYKQSESISESESKDLSVAVNEATSTSSGVKLEYGLLAKLNLTENTTDSTYTYTLELSNVNTIEENSIIKAKDIKILGGLSDWNGYTNGLIITTSTLTLTPYLP